MSDIVERLRDAARIKGYGLHGEAADEILRLRSEYDAMARAALKASGWAEMKEALMIAADYIEMDREGKPRTPGYVLGEIAAAISGRKP